MAGSAGAGNEEAISGINVTPLVDITLVLLIIFIATSVIQMKAEMGVQLPKQPPPNQPLPENPPPPPLMLSISDKGEFRINNVEVKKTDLREQLEAAHAKSDKTSVMIISDRKTEYDAVVFVLDMVRKAEIKQYAINVPKAGDEEDK